MLFTSKDILYIVISFCILWVTVFLCWMFFYAIRILKNASKIAEEFRVRLQSLTESINHVKNRVEQISNLMTFAAEGATGLVKKVVSRKAEEWLDRGAESANKTAKEAVNKAVESAAKKIKKITDLAK